MTDTHGPCPVRLVTDTATAARSIRRGLIVILLILLYFLFLLVSTNHSDDHFCCNLKISSSFGKAGSFCQPIARTGTVHSMCSEA